MPRKAIRRSGEGQGTSPQGEALSRTADAVAVGDHLRLLLAAKAGGIGFWDSDLANGTVFYDAVWKRQLGYAENEVPNLQDSFDSRLHPDDKDMALARMQRYLDGELRDYEVEFRLRHKDGSYRWMLSRGEAIRDANGVAIRVVGSHTDITARKQSERSALDSEHRYASLVQSVDGVVWEAEPEGRRFTYVSPRAESFLGYPSGDWLVAGFWLEHVHSDDRAWVAERCLERNISADSYQLEYRMLAADGRVVWIHDSVSVFREKGAAAVLRGLLLDVSERRQTEAMLLREQARLLLSLETARLGTWDYDIDADRLTLDDAMLRLLRTSAETLGGHTLPSGDYARRFGHPEDVARVASEMREALHTNDPSFTKQMEHRLIRADGTVAQVVVRFGIIKDSTGRTVRGHGVVQDITERKESEAELRRSQALLEQAGQIAGVGGWELDLVKGELSFSPQTCRIHEVPLDYRPSLEGAIDFYAPEVRPAIAAAVEAGRSAGRPWDLELPFITAKGRRIVVRAQGEAERRDGQIVRLFGALHDITVRKETEARLKRLLQGESLLSTLAQRFIELSPAEFDTEIVDLLQSVAVFASMARVSLYMYSADGGRILHTHEWCADPTAAMIETMKEIPVGHYGFFHREVAQHRVVRIATIDDLPAGSERDWVEQNGFRPTLLFPLTSRSRLLGVVGFYGWLNEKRDFDPDLLSFLSSFAVSLANFVSRKAADEERLLLERQLNQAQKMEAIGTLAGGIAHDFNNILGAIVGNVGLARMEVEVGKGVDDSLSEIERAADRAGALVQQILAFSRQQEHARRVILLGPVVKEAVRFVRATIPAVVTIETSVGRSVPPVLADPTQMHQILLNLCANAWHALEDGPGRITVALDGVTLSKTAVARIGGIGAGRYARFTVSDTGRGMDEATVKRIFDPFFTTKTVGKGTGLGMSVVHGIVRGHNGGISIDTEPGQGTIVRVYLPAATGESGAIVETMPVQVGRGEHVLLVDDEESIVRVMSRILERLGYRTSSYSRPHEAIAAFRLEPGEYDAVITDFEMPEITGLDVAREMLGLRPDARILLWSGRFRDEVRGEAAALGIKALITKPCPTSVLSQVLRETLDG